eukprot:scaffold56206_cov74-Phaeocystis_antarctica.AAC.3
MTECAAALSRGTSFLAVPSPTLANYSARQQGASLRTKKMLHSPLLDMMHSSSTPSRPPRPAAASESGAALFNAACCSGARFLLGAHGRLDAGAASRIGTPLDSRLGCTGHTQHASCPKCTG